MFSVSCSEKVAQTLKNFWGWIRLATREQWKLILEDSVHLKPQVVCYSPAFDTGTDNYVSTACMNSTTQSAYHMPTVVTKQVSNG